ncbi:MAG: hypothetical protein NC338_02975 [Firmicutes bacterium]|nr:hypothetical protein [Bacillota bacterium]MCM1401239.1 hypothetical protein [Bacteroides sp.]MCM1477212.1 hypothetical protein [Bacteroides sp.]
MNRIDKTIGITGVIMLGSIVATYVIASLTLLFGGHISALTALFGLFAGIAIGFLFFPKESLNIIAGAALLSEIISGIFVWIGSSLFDFSYDGNFYHQPTIMALTMGWNPIHDAAAPVELTVWSLHYARAMETVQAAAAMLFDNVEAAKCVNFMLIAATGLISYSALRRYTSISPRFAAITALVAVSNPVVICQCLTFYIDYTKYLYLILTIIAIIGIAHDRKPSRGIALLAGVVWLAIGTKFNIFFEEGVAIAAALAWLMYKKLNHAALITTITGIGALVTGVLILGWHPYITNWIGNGHPLYPLMGEGALEIMEAQTPAIYENGNRFVNFFISLATPELFVTVDSRNGAFGPIAILIFAIAWFLLLKHIKVFGGLAVYISVWCLASCFFFEQSWWGRYVCQLWLPVPLAVAVSFQAAKRIIPILLSSLVVITALLCTSSVYYSSLRRTLFRKAVCNALKDEIVEARNLNVAFRQQLEQGGIQVFESKSLNAADYGIMYFFGFTGEEKPILKLNEDQITSVRLEFYITPFNYSEVTEGWE